MNPVNELISNPEVSFYDLLLDYNNKKGQSNNTLIASVDKYLFDQLDNETKTELLTNLKSGNYYISRPNLEPLAKLVFTYVSLAARFVKDFINHPFILAQEDDKFSRISLVLDYLFLGFRARVTLTMNGRKHKDTINFGDLARYTACHMDCIDQPNDFTNAVVAHPDYPALRLATMNMVLWAQSNFNLNYQIKTTITAVGKFDLHKPECVKPYIITVGYNLPNQIREYLCQYYKFVDGVTCRNFIGIPLKALRIYV